MKGKQILVSTIILFGNLDAWGQGTLTFVYDQQSASATTPAEGGTADLQTSQPFGQSFNPSLSAVGFIQLSVFSSSPISMSVVLRADSISGQILGTSDPMALPTSFDGFPNFVFSTPVSVTPGTTYYLQPVLASGGAGVGGEFVLNYPGGMEFFQGAPLAGDDLWFREGIVVPEPSAWGLMLLGSGVLALGWRRRGARFLS